MVCAAGTMFCASVSAAFAAWASFATSRGIKKALAVNANAVVVRNVGRSMLSSIDISDEGFVIEVDEVKRGEVVIKLAVMYVNLRLKRC